MVLALAVRTMAPVPKKCIRRSWHGKPAKVVYFSKQLRLRDQVQLEMPSVRYLELLALQRRQIPRP